MESGSQGEAVSEMIEIWKPVLGYELHYEVSSFGRVRRVRPGRGASAGRILRQKLPNRTNDYCRVQLCRNDVKRSFGVHVLVAEAFHGKRPRGKLPNHKDLNKVNNHADNLEWLTRRQNQMHAISAGRKPGRRMPGSANGNARLKESQVAEIIRQKGRIGQRVLATLCGVSKTSIQQIHQRRKWKAEWPEDLRVREFPI